MEKEIYYVVNEGEIVYASLDEEKAEAFADSSMRSDLEDIVEESGRDIDDLTPEELDEFILKSGFEGGYYYTGSVMFDMENPEKYPETFTTDEGDEVSYDDLINNFDNDEYDEEYADEDF